MDHSAAEAYDWGADAYYVRAHLRLRVLAELLRRHGLAGARVLDVGAGLGTLARLLGLREGYVGLDQYEEALRQAGDLDLRRWHWDDAVCAPLPDPPFDIVVASGFLEYIESREAFLRRVHEVLRPGGTLFTSMIWERYWPRRWHAFRGRPHRHALWKRIETPAGMDALFRAAGLVPAAATPVINVRHEWPHEGYSCRRRREVDSFATLRPGLFTDQLIYEVRGPGL
ncbi:MAG TPA: class I SAM-dependent methyltransferase [Planctomycetota bacterium]|nr:class I SAM-dependent methyltransferase [Planctomycetota bacterium]